MIRKSNSRFEIFFILGFLLTLIVAFSTFFLGLRMGINQTESKYAYLKTNPMELETESSYTQQDLVTFYYVVFQPYQQFKDNYLALVDVLNRSNSNSNSKMALKEIRNSAEKQYEQISAISIAASSPLLKEAHSDILKSLKLFDDSIDRTLAASGNSNGSQYAQSLSKDEFTEKAIAFGLQAQKKYYSSILKWTAKTNKSISGEYSFAKDTTVQQWSNLSLAVKNKAVTDIMASDKLFVSYLPQDMTAKIDQMIDSGKATTLSLHSVSSIVKILTETEAVQSKEFIKWKSTYYASEPLPALPFFIED